MATDMFVDGQSAISHILGRWWFLDIIRVLCVCMCVCVYVLSISKKPE